MNNELKVYVERDRLKKMLKEACNVLGQESADCPWCNGYFSYKDSKHSHDETCELYEALGSFD